MVTSMAEARRGRGRPAKADGERLDALVQARVRAEDKDAMDRLAVECERSLSDWARLALLDALRRRWKP